MPELDVKVTLAPEGFDEWGPLLELLRAAFAYQEHRVSPRSSAYSLSVESLAKKAADEHLFLASLGGELAGCVFATDRGHLLYVSKLAVWPHLQRLGIGRSLMSAAESFARESRHLILELESRIELTENHRTFESLGFSKISEHAHEGYDRPTFIRMQRRLSV